MLRFIVLLLLIANGLFFAWTKDYLGTWGLASPSAAKNESYRLAEQIEPERIVIKHNDSSPTPVVAAPETPAAPTAPSALVTVCLTAGSFNDRQTALIKQTLSTKLPDLKFRFDTVNAPARWIIYMGKYPNINARELKIKELNQINVRYDILAEASLEPGLSLGSFDSQSAANQSLQQLAKKGVRTARVLQESPEQKAQVLFLPAVNEETLGKVNAAFASLVKQLSIKPLQVCK